MKEVIHRLFTPLALVFNSVTYEQVINQALTASLHFIVACMNLYFSTDLNTTLFPGVPPDTCRFVVMLTLTRLLITAEQ